MAERPNTIEVTLNKSPRFTVTFTVDGTATAPSSTPSWRQVTPAGVDTTVTTGWTNPSTGVYERDVVLNAVGDWRFAATGTLTVLGQSVTAATEFIATVTSALP